MVPGCPLSTIESTYHQAISGNRQSTCWGSIVVHTNSVSAGIPIAAILLLTVTSFSVQVAAQKAYAPISAEAVIERIKAITEEGGSDEWDALVKPILLEAYDVNTSGSIDTPQKVRTIPCQVLLEMDRIIKPYDKGRSGLTWTYGFQPDTPEKKYGWHGNQLGFDEAMRSVAYQYMKGCGLPSR